MFLYESEFLSVNWLKNKMLLEQRWKSSPPNVNSFKEEMLSFFECFKKVKPNYVLWFQENLKLVIDTDLEYWIEENINKPGKRIGNEKTAFIVSKDVLTHLSVMNIFDEGKSVVTAKHFANEKEAYKWFNDSQEVTTSENLKNRIDISYDGLDKEGFSTIKVRCKPQDIEGSVKLFKSIFEENIFIKENMHRFSSLTKREKKILELYARGLKHAEIAEKLFISLFTVQTHWRNIKKKLYIKTGKDIDMYANAFNLI